MNRRTPSTRIPSAAATCAVCWPEFAQPHQEQRLAGQLEDLRVFHAPPGPRRLGAHRVGQERANASRSTSTCSVIWIEWMPEVLVRIKSCSIAPGCRSTQSTPALHAWNQRSRGTATSRTAPGTRAAAISTSPGAPAAIFLAIRGDNQPHVGSRLVHLAELRFGQHAGLEANQNRAHLRMYQLWSSAHPPCRSLQHSGGRVQISGCLR